MQSYHSATDLYRRVANAEQDRWIALDEDDVIVACGRGVNASIAAAVGECLWDVYPGLEDDLRAILDVARAEGTSRGVAYSAWLDMFFDARVRVVGFNRDPTLVIAYTSLSMKGPRARRDLRAIPDDPKPLCKVLEFPTV